jgi:fused signal recognition particle receptor
MSSILIFVILAVAIVAIGIVIGVVALVNGRKQPPPAVPPTAPSGTITEERPPEAPPESQAPVTTIERPESTASRLVRLRQRLARSQGGLGRGLLRLLSRDRLDEDTWEEIEDTLITADVGVAPTQELVERLRTRLRVEGGADVSPATVLREELLALVDPSMDRRIAVTGADGKPGVVLVVGVNGSGKTTSVGKLARVLVAQDKTVVLGAADTCPEGSDPASVAFESVRTGVEQGIDVVVVDTAGRLQNKAGLMDELGKVKRVVERHAPVTEVLLVLDATTGQNGLVQARVFREVVDVSGIVLTKLDGSAKGGIVVAVQRELGVPVKLVGLGEGPDDLAPFDPEAFVDALLDQG